MKKYFAHTYWMLLDLIRQPTYIVSSIAFPCLFYLIFAVPESKDIASSNFLLASFSAFATFGIVFLQFGVSISQEKTQSWSLFINRLPVSTVTLLLARLTTAIIMALLAVFSLVILAFLTTAIKMDFTTWFTFSISLVIFSLPFCLMGMALGYWFSDKSVLPVGNLIYLPLSFAGGLWKPPDLLPKMLSSLSEYLPTRHYGEIVWSIVNNTNFAKNSAINLVLYSGLFLILTFAGLKLNERH